MWEKKEICQRILWLIDFQAVDDLCPGMWLCHQGSPGNLRGRTVRTTLKGDAVEEEIRKTLRAREALENQSTFVRRVIAGAYGVNAVYFFRNVNHLNTVTLNAVDILCASRPQARRIAVMHLILQNGRQLPRPLLIRLFDAIDEYNKSNQRDDQRPRRGLHMTEAHLLAIADTPVLPDIRQEVDASAKARAKAKTKATPKPSVLPGTIDVLAFIGTSNGASSCAKTVSSTSTWTRWKRLRKREQGLLTPWW